MSPPTGQAKIRVGAERIHAIAACWIVLRPPLPSVDAATMDGRTLHERGVQPGTSLTDCRSCNKILS
jgi:hypothetical protein